MKKIKLYDFQVEGINTAVNQLREGNAFLLCDEMGLGKTIQALEIRKSLNLNGPTLVVVPSSCQHIWTGCGEEDIRIFTGSISTILNLSKNSLVVTTYDILRNAYKYYITEKLDQGALSNDELIRLCLIHGKSIERTKALTNDALRRELLEISRTIKHKGSDKKHLVCSAFMKQQWDLFIMDEVHKTRNIQSSVTKAVAFINSKYRLALSGTPVMNYGSELLCIWKYALGLFHLKWDIIENDPNSDYCKEMIQKICLGRKKTEIDELVQILPKRDKSREDVILDWDDLDQKQLYVRLKYSTIEVLNQFNAKRNRELQNNFFQKMQLLRQICIHSNQQNKQEKFWNPAIHSNFSKWNKRCIFSILLGLKRTSLYPLRQLIIKYFICADSLMIQPSPKMVYVYDEMLKLGRTDKMIVFCSYKTLFQNVIQPWFEQIGHETLLFCGGSRSKQQQVLKEFKNSKDTKILLIVKSAGSEGLNMQFDANVCIILDPHFNMAVDEQAAQRIDRIGQEKEVIIRKLFMKGSIDEAMKIMQKDKQTNIEAWTGKGEGKRSMQTQGLFLSERDTV